MIIKEDISLDKFIGIYHNVLNEESCKIVIDEFEHVLTTSSDTMWYGNKGDDELTRRDYSLIANDILSSRVEDMINFHLHESLKLYLDDFFILKQIRAVSNLIKVQKVPPRGGFHKWHCENGSIASSRRCLAWMIYLNDMPEGEGETEFIWQGVRILPKAGTAVIWPASWTHTHRGNPVYSQSKYVATGWYTHAD